MKLAFLQPTFHQFRLFISLCAVESQLFSGCAADTVSTLPLSCSALAHQAFYVVGCTWLFFFFFSIPAHLLFAWRSPPDSGLECFPSSPSDSSAPGDCFPGSEQHAARAGGSAYHTCCRIKGHSRRSGIIGGR